jgi:hypothetical protein
MSSEPDDRPPAPATLQFDRAEYAESAAASTGIRCALCKQLIPASYYEINGRVTCPACRENVVRTAMRGSRFGRFLRASFAGALAGAVGAGIYFGVAAISGYEIGLIALVVGLLVGGAVRWGSRARGGWFYQLLAIFLTYMAIASSYALLAVREYVQNPERHRAWRATATVPVAAPELGEVPTAPSPDRPADLPGSPAGTTDVIAAIALIVVGVGLPIIIGVKHPIGLLIVGIALYEAWKINRRPALRIGGPYVVAGTPPAPAAIAPALPSPEDAPHA